MPAIALGSKRVLFMDDTLLNMGISYPHTFRQGTPTRRGQVMSFMEKPWEGCYCGAISVIYDQANPYNIIRPYRMWYRGNKPLANGQADLEYTCYADSEDGLTWVKPVLGLKAFGGNSQNNIIRLPNSTTSETHNFFVRKDTNPAAPANERYKAIGGLPPYGFTSPDGLTWTQVGSAPLVTAGVGFDTLNVLVARDEVNALYWIFTRDNQGGFKAIRAFSAANFAGPWTDRGNLDFGGAAAQSLYSPGIQTYYRAPHTLIGLPKRFLDRGTFFNQVPVFGSSLLLGNGSSDSMLMFSHLDQANGGVLWSRQDEAIMYPGPELENQGPESNEIYPTLVPIEDQVGGFALQNASLPDCGVELITFRPDNFKAVHAAYTDNVTFTNLYLKDFNFTGDRLMINFQASAAGQINLEFQTTAGDPIAGFSLNETLNVFGDFCDFIYGWSTGVDIGSLAGTDLRLLIRIHDCNLYSIQFGTFRKHTVHVRDVGLNPIVGALVKIKGADGQQYWKRTWWDGSIWFGLPQGTYSINVSAPNYTSAQGSITIAADGSSTYTLFSNAPSIVVGGSGFMGFAP